MEERVVPESSEPQTNDAFRWAQGPCGRQLRARALEPMADAWFTTRDLPLAGTPEEAATGWQALADEAMVDRDHLIRLTQVHGAGVHIHRPGAPADARHPPADAVVSGDPAVAMAVQVADCVPVLIADMDGTAVAAVHAGWRGTAAGAVRAAVNALAEQCGVPADRLVAATGPSIGPCCYRVGVDVQEAFARAGADARSLRRWFTPEGPKGLMLDLWTATRDQLEAAGLRPDRIHVAGLCTACHPSRFHSYRRDGEGAGRMAGVIRLRRR